MRVSNRGGKRLYGEGMGYRVRNVIPGYYQDGKDALFLRKGLEGLVEEMKRKDIMEHLQQTEEEGVVVEEGGGTGGGRQWEVEDSGGWCRAFFLEDGGKKEGNDGC